MNSKLKALLVAVGAVVVGGTIYTINLPAPGVRPADLADAGIAECVATTVRATVRLGTAALADAGEATDAGSRPHYRAFYVPARACDGGQIILTGLPSGMEAFRVEVLSDAGTFDGLRPDLGQCACRRASAGTCRARLPDGGLATPPTGVELQPGTWQGSCRRKSCGVIAGDQGMDWPEDCP